MAGLSNTLEKELLDRIFKQTAMSGISALHVSIHSADPADTGANELPLAGGYARQQLDPDVNNTTHTNWSSVGTTGTAQEVTNAAAITFPTATADWNGGSPVTYFGLFTAGTGGTFIGGGQVNGTTGAYVLSGNILSFPIGNLHFQID